MCCSVTLHSAQQAFEGGHMPYRMTYVWTQCMDKHMALTHGSPNAPKPPVVAPRPVPTAPKPPPVDPKPAEVDPKPVPAVLKVAVPLTKAELSPLAFTANGESCLLDETNDEKSAEAVEGAAAWSLLCPVQLGWGSGCVSLLVEGALAASLPVSAALSLAEGTVADAAGTSASEAGACADACWG